MSHLGILKNLQSKAKTMKLFTGMTKQQTIRKLHQTRRTLLKESPHAYINHFAFLSSNLTMNLSDVRV